ncbi:MAG: ubiquinol-cytochrome C chaperone [Alphaproteobacteria bacterium]|nr:ubiquinol-cytochrome C chaperone [Alphaproteobacteria bacterium]
MRDWVQRWTGPGKADREAAGRLLTTVTGIARQPGFFGEGRVPDTLEGRTELMFLHAALALMRLKASPAQAGLAQSFTDRFFRLLDAGLREAGVGDLSVPRKMRALASSFYGRLAAYEGALGDEAALRAAIGRNVFADSGHPFAAALAAYAQETADGLAGADPGALEALTVWRPAPALS